MDIPFLMLYLFQVKLRFHIFYISVSSIFSPFILGYKKDTKNPLFLMPLNVPLFLLLHLGKTDIIFYLLFLIPFLRGYSKVYKSQKPDNYSAAL